MQVPLTDVQVLQDPAEVETVAGEKDETFAHMKEWKRQYMRGISHTPSQAGVYYEALKGSSHSLAKGCARNVTISYINLSTAVRHSTWTCSIIQGGSPQSCVYLRDTHKSSSTICFAD